MNKPRFAVGAACRTGNVSASAKFPKGAHFFHTMVLLMPLPPIRLLSLPMLQDYCAVKALRLEPGRSFHHSIARNEVG
jgi:hypothetical protein